MTRWCRHCLSVVCLLVASVLLLTGCQKAPQVTFFDKGQFPQELSRWGLLLQQDGELVPNQHVVVYDLKSALFTDYAHKFRTVYAPRSPGTSAHFSTVENLPVGSIISKTFYYPAERQAGHERLIKTTDEARAYGVAGLRLETTRLIETRLLVHTEEGWVGLPYIWNETQTEAYLEITGGSQQLTLQDKMGRRSFQYVIPDFNQCQGCHIENLSAGAMQPVGFKARHLDKPYAHFYKADNQLDYLLKTGVLTERPMGDYGDTVDWQDESQSLDDRARSYLDINCGHCHNPTGPADTSGMFLTRDTEHPVRLGVCKLPIAAGQGTGGRPVGITPGHPEQSILSYRMASDDPGAMMPELGRTLVHAEGVALIDQWITNLEGEC